ncbi:MAG: hypothetical protein HFI42_03970 [Lachnospiraceae bacterium]|nr:hypothetical protein [Lachnospiraceae bacterium]
MGKWIWLNGEDTCERQRENIRGNFAAAFSLENRRGEVTLEICAVSKYMVYLNGKQIGRGPVRGAKGSLVYDTYSLLPACRTGDNYLAIRVWNYGWSTYQSISDRPGLAFTVRQQISGETAEAAGQQYRILAASGETVKCREDRGHMRYAPKRNVNLGFGDYYDARRDNLQWIENRELTADWQQATVLLEDGNVREPSLRPIRAFDVRDQYPARLEAIQDVARGCWQLTLNTRRAFFGERKDADETIFAGFIGGFFEAEEDMEGVISFPNRTWNGILGSFRLGGQVYQADNANREIPVAVKAGEQFFLLQVSGKFDDLYCHLELRFPKKLTGKRFFVVGPTARIIQKLDGVSRIYGGLEEFNEMEQYTQKHRYIWESEDFEQLSRRIGPGELRWIDQRDMYEDLYLLSLARTEKVLQEYAVETKDCGILWQNQDITVIDLPKTGDFRRILVDFGNIYVGQLVFTLRAAAGTVIDIYGFENYYRREIDDTIGLNNSVHYVASEGWQTYQCMARMGLRYALITVRGAREPVEISDFHLRHETYSAPALGQFACSDMLLNRIFEMCRDTNLLCTEDAFTDSPTYEQAFWTGDAQLSALIHAWVFGDYDFCTYVEKLAVTAQDNGLVMNALTPTDWNTAIPMWMMSWVIAVFETAELTGSFRHVEELYPYLYRVLDFYRQFIRKDGGFLISAWNMIDWAAMDIGNHCVVTAHQAILAYCYKMFGAYCASVGRAEEAEGFWSDRQRMLDYMNSQMWDADRMAYRDGWSPETGYAKTFSIQTHIMLYLYDGIVGEERKRIVEGYLADAPADFLEAGSPFMLHYLYQALGKAGQGAGIFADIRKRWGRMLFYDSTTCWEVFPGFYENGRTRSYCHSWSASPAYFMIRDLSGLKVLEPGFGKVAFTGCPIDLDWCRCSIPTPHGRMNVDWIREGETYDVQLQLPEGIRLVRQEDERMRIRVRELKRSGTP